MRKSMKRWIALGGAATMALSLVACGGDGTESGKGNSGKVKSVNVTLPTVYDLPDAEKVEAEINKITEDKYGIHLELEFITSGNWLQQSNLQLHPPHLL